MTTRTIKFRSETSLAAFIMSLPKSASYEVVEDPTHMGWYTMSLS
jgi:hypothetical protein